MNVREKYRGMLKMGSCWAIFLLALLFAGLLISKITLYCDDYFYGSVFKEGLSNFWELTKWHYLYFNGRAFIHFVAEIVLAFGTNLYVVLAPIMLFSIFALCVKMQYKEIQFHQLLLVAAIGIMSIIALPVYYLNTSLLWMSSAFNYVFPVSVLMIAIWYSNHCIEKQKCNALGVIIPFLAGATTEQCGLAAIVCVGVLCLVALLRKKIKLHIVIFLLLPMCIGYLTVVFAPGTWVRIDNEVSEGLLSILKPEVFLQRIHNYMQYLTGKHSVWVLFVVFAILTSVHQFVTKKRHGILILGIPVAVIYTILFYLDYNMALEYLPIIYYIVVAFVYLLDDEMLMSGALIVGMLASQFIMLCSTTATYRTTLPALFIIMAISLSNFVKCIKHLPEGVLVFSTIGIMGICMIGYIPNYKGYSENATINEQNMESLANVTSDVITLNVDYNSNYRYYMFFDSMSYLYSGLGYYGVQENSKISYASAKQNVSGLYGNNAYGLPVYEEEGELYFPLICATQLCGGGEGGWSHAESGVIIWIDDMCYIVKTNGEVYSWDRDKKECVLKVADVKVTAPWYTFYMPAEMFKELFGITWEYNVAENIYYLHR